MSACVHPSIVGIGHSIGHHGEILQGAFRDGAGETVAGLVTAPCSSLEARARFLIADSARIEIEAGGSRSLSKTERAVRLTLGAVAQVRARPGPGAGAGAGAGAGGALSLESNIPPRRGLGSSTADVVAAIRAVSDAYAVRLGEAEVARLAVMAEGAADPVMFEGAGGLLFAQRDGRILERFARVLPELVLFSIDTGGAGVDTLANPMPRYSGRELRSFERLRVALRRAIEREDLPSIATVATASAYLNERYLPKPRFADIVRLAARVHALGIQVSHSGTVVGLMFDPTDGALEVRLAECEARCGFLGLAPQARVSSATWTSLRSRKPRVS